MQASPHAAESMVRWWPRGGSGGAAEDAPPPRRVVVNGRPPGDERGGSPGFCANRVTTSRYTAWNFVPKNLWEQFHKASNVYFLVISVMQLIPSITTTNGMPTVAFPLLFVLVVNAAKDGFEDWKRRKADDEENGLPTLVVPNVFNEQVVQRDPTLRIHSRLSGDSGGDHFLFYEGGDGDERVRRLSSDASTGGATRGGRPRGNSQISWGGATPAAGSAAGGSAAGGSATPAAAAPPLTSRDLVAVHAARRIRWRDVCVGDVIICRNRERFPADMVLLASSDGLGLAFIETSSLDGETNLKVKQAAPDICAAIGNEIPASILACKDLRGTCECTAPNSDLTTFEGAFRWGKGETGGTARSGGGVFRRVSRSPAAFAAAVRKVSGRTEIGCGAAADGGAAGGCGGDAGGNAGSARNGSLNGASSACILAGPSVSGASGPGAAPSLTRVAGATVPLSYAQLLLRGCGLRNTSWVLGLVVYTGPETKIQMNSSPPPHKVSRIEASTNWLTLIVFICQLLICLTGAVATYIVASSDHYRAMAYLRLSADSPARQSVFRFFTWLVLFVNMIPISLIVTMGMVKAAQGIFIGVDPDMYHAKTDTYAAARTTDLNEELGQIQHVFTDKTGTITQNRMEFRRCCVHGEAFGRGLTEIRRNVLRRQGVSFQEDEAATDDGGGGGGANPFVNISDPALSALCADFDLADARCARILDFLVHLAVNQTVVPEAGEGRPVGGAAAAANGGVSYSASSPDEGALVYAAKHFNVTFVRRTACGLVLAIGGLGQVAVEIVATFDFDSTRKRSSIVCKFPADNARSLPEKAHALLARDRCVLYCKGADSVILPRLGPGQEAAPETRECIARMEEYAVDGLRTLCIAKTELAADFLQHWRERYEAACVAVAQRQRLLDKAAREVEKDFTLQGITGIEDKLQTGVSDTLEALQLAGINVWMLTGDRVETAVNIGVATSLLAPLSSHFSYQWDAFPGDDGERARELAERMHEDLRELRALRRDDPGSARGQVNFRKHLPIGQRLKRFASFFFLGTALRSRVGAEEEGRPPARPEDGDEEGEVARLPAGLPSVIIDGAALSRALEPDLRLTFLELCCLANTVVCCRLTPYQKGAVVTLVKETLGKVTLAIGDGANDCNMIQCADVGVGLRGEEGLQAFNSSDFGISQFRFLKVLLLCHGHWCYWRLSRLVVYIFYKNLVIVLPLFYFAFYSLYSGQKVYNELMYQLYNVLFTSWSLAADSAIESRFSSGNISSFSTCSSIGDEIPVIVFGVLDQDVPRQLALAFPQLYRSAHRGAFFNTGIFCRWVLNGFCASLVLALVPLYAFHGDSGLGDGHVASFWFAGHISFYVVMLVVNVKIVLSAAALSGVFWLGIATSVLSWLLALTVFSSWPSVGSEILGLQFSMLSEPLFYVVLAGTTLCCVSWDYAWKVFRATFCPEAYHVIQRAARGVPEIGRFPRFLVDAKFRGVAPEQPTSATAAAAAGVAAGAAAEAARPSRPPPQPFADDPLPPPRSPAALPRVTDPSPHAPLRTGVATRRLSSGASRRAAARAPSGTSPAAPFPASLAFIRRKPTSPIAASPSRGFAFSEADCHAITAIRSASYAYGPPDEPEEGGGPGGRVGAGADGGVGAGADGGDGAGAGGGAGGAAVG